MAKCIQRQGVPVRCTDGEAFQIVERDHDGDYCSKKVWRNWPPTHYAYYGISGNFRRLTPPEFAAYQILKAVLCGVSVPEQVSATFTPHAIDVIRGQIRTDVLKRLQ